MRDISSGIIDALESSHFSPVTLISIDFDVPLRFASTYGPVVIDGFEYFGAGNLGGISALEEDTEMNPQEMEIHISGVNPDSLQVAGGDGYINRDVFVHIAFLDDNGAVIDNTALSYFVGKTDEVAFEYGSRAAITVIARNILADWQRPKIERNTNADQQALYPGDKGFEFVAQIADKKVIWPAKEFYQ